MRVRTSAGASGEASTARLVVRPSFGVCGNGGDLGAHHMGATPSMRRRFCGRGEQTGVSARGAACWEEGDLGGAGAADAGHKGWGGDFKKSQPRVIDSSTYYNTP